MPLQIEGFVLKENLRPENWRMHHQNLAQNRTIRQEKILQH